MPRSGWVAARAAPASASSREVVSPDRRRAAISWARSLVRSVIGRSWGLSSRPRSVAAEDRRDPDEVAFAIGGVGEHRLDRQRRPDDILAEDVLELDRLGGWRDVLGVELGEDRVLVE